MLFARDPLLINIDQDAPSKSHLGLIAWKSSYRFASAFPFFVYPFNKISGAYPSAVALRICLIIPQIKYRWFVIYMTDYSVQTIVIVKIGFHEKVLRG